LRSHNKIIVNLSNRNQIKVEQLNIHYQSLLNVDHLIILSCDHIKMHEFGIIGNLVMNLKLNSLAYFKNILSYYYSVTM